MPSKAAKKAIMARIRGHRRRTGAAWAAVCPSTGGCVVGELDRDVAPVRLVSDRDLSYGLPDHFRVFMDALRHGYLPACFAARAD